MKKVLLLMVAVLMISSVAMADHIGVYVDQAGTSCSFAPGGYFQGMLQGPYVIHKFSVGATGSRWKISLPAGSAVFAFAQAGTFVPNGSATSDMSLGYGGCTTGSFVLGALVGNFSAGSGAVVAADLQTDVIYTDCGFTQLVCTGGTYYVGGSGNCNEPLADKPTTWGSVKALYR